MLEKSIRTARIITIMLNDATSDTLTRSITINLISLKSHKINISVRKSDSITRYTVILIKGQL